MIAIDVPGDVRFACFSCVRSEKLRWIKDRAICVDIAASGESMSGLW